MMKKNEMFNGLVENAFDFLAKAISEIKEQPKYSVIHFYTAVELLLKARLMHEHWSLVVARKQEPDWEKFVKGDFQSVSLDEAAEKLRRVVCSGLTEDEHKAFKEVAKDRNKAVHFFHEAHSEKENIKLTQEVVKKQMKAWYFLHKILLGEWKAQFVEWEEKISKFDSNLRELHEFLQVIFDNLAEEIKKKKENGAWFSECPSCGFESNQHDRIEEGIIYESKCFVCGLVKKCFNAKCPDCGKIVVVIQDETSPACQSCGCILDSENLQEALEDGSSSYVAAMEGDDSYDHANCSYCDGYHTVVRAKNNQWVCLECLSFFDSIERCQWCSFCEGLSGWHRDD